ncbi:MAG TPA: hypothetical protein GX729_05380 [Firmicutes bacterium]|nr:hypothetical protein [Bacillota bacterium]
MLDAGQCNDSYSLAVVVLVHDCLVRVSIV